MKWDHLFEWQMRMALAKKDPDAVRTLRAKAKEYAPVHADINDVRLKYDSSGQLYLADAKPTGYLIEARA